MRRAILVAVAVALLAPSPATAAQRLLYSSDWSGLDQIYAADPSGARATAQLTFGRAPACGTADWCGYRDPLPSPDGRYVLLTDWASCQSGRHHSSLFVVRAEGTHRRLIARSKSQCLPGTKAVWAPGSRRIAYRMDGQLHIARTDRPGDRVVGYSDLFAWSPDGKSLAYTTHRETGSGSLLIDRNGRTRMLAPEAETFTWAPNGRWVAYVQTSSDGQPELDLIHPDGTGHRSLPMPARSPGWSGDSRFLSVSTTGGTAIVDVSTSKTLTVFHDLSGISWRPRGHVLVLDGGDGIYAVDVVAGTQTLLTRDHADELVWSPDGRSIAYVARRTLGTYRSGDLKVADLSGKVSTLVQAAGAYGGSIYGLAWTRAPAGTRYRRAQQRVLATVRDDGLTAPWAITRLATDGDHVAYVSCGRVFLWTPSARTVVQAEPVASFSPRCTLHGDYYPFWIYTLALSGDRIAFGDLEGNMGQTWGLYAGAWRDPTSLVSLDRVYSANGSAVGNGGLGDLVGAGGLLYFSTWRDDYADPKAHTLEQQIRRVDTGGCPCAVIASSPGPLVPFDVDGNRVVAGGENATVVYEAAGMQLVSVPVSPLAAQISGSDLVILRQGTLLDYDATSGGRLHAWSLPDVPSGGECASPHYGAWECGRPRLVLEDVAHGLAAYVLDGQVHVLRLADDADATVGAGTLARFTSAGLVYANDATLRLVPYAQLPVRP